MKKVTGPTLPAADEAPPVDEAPIAAAPTKTARRRTAAAAKGAAGTSTGRTGR